MFAVSAGSGASAEQASRVTVIAASAAVTLVAWLWIASHAVHPALPGPHRHGFDASTFASSVAMWQAMMLAMMTPAFLRWMLTFADLTAGEGAAARSRAIALLAAGYFSAWLGYSLGGAAVQWVLQALHLLPDGRMTARLGGAVLIAAGFFQFAPARRACLTHCRNPLTFLLSRWRNGRTGGFRLGLHHGAYCVGCCWLLMLTGLAMGVMNLAWMAILTLLIAAEQILPRGDRIARAAGIALAGWGIVLLAGAVR